MSTARPLEPSWWRDPDAVEERRALIEGFDVRSLEAATADLRERCEALERRQAAGEPVAVGEVAQVLLGQWSVAFQSELADSQRHYFGGDEGRLAYAAEQGRKAAVAVRDRFLVPDRIDGESLQQALNIATADAQAFKVGRDDASAAEPNPTLVPAAPVEYAAEAHSLWREAQAREAAHPGDDFYARVVLLARARLIELYGELGPAGRAALARRLDAGDLAGLAQAHRLVVDGSRWRGHLGVRRVWGRSQRMSL